MGSTLATALEYDQGKVIALRWDLTENAGAWSPFIQYQVNDFAKYQSKTWKALRASLGSAPSEGADWTADPARVDPDTLAFAVTPPGYSTKVHTLISAGTILEKRGAGVYEARINTTPAAGIWKAELLGSGSGQTALPYYAKVIAGAVAMPFTPGVDSGSYFKPLLHTITAQEINAAVPVQVACDDFVPTSAVAFVVGGANVSDLANCDGSNYWVNIAISDGVNPSPFNAGDTLMIFAMR